MSSDGTSIELGIDILGSTFFLLTRYEEQVSTARDARGRFPASASVAVRGEFLDRPLVNEYLEVLWTCLQRLWPGLVRRRRSSRVFVTHDVDHPCCSYGVPWLYAVKHAGGDILHRGDLSLAAHRLTRLMRPRSGAAERDPCFTFPFLMLASEQRGVTSTFNFICTQRPSSIDAYYSLDDAFIRALMVQIHERGHEVGYHASYRSGDDPKRIAGEFQMLRNTAASLHIAQSNWGGRHHYLRWRADSWSQWEAAGLQYDSSLGYPELAGFRCGTCYEYPVYSLLTHQALGVRERPLIAMDVSLLSKRYAGLRNEQALATISELAATCRRFSGDFVLLWHNDMVVGPAARAFYTRILEAVVPN